MSDIYATKKAGEDFIAAKAKEAGVVTLPSGLLYKVTSQNTNGLIPSFNTVCDVNYIGKRINSNGAEILFDACVNPANPRRFSPENSIAGLSEALQVMRQGDVLELYVPFELAYGARGRPPVIPSYSALVFSQLTLLSFA